MQNLTFFHRADVVHSRVELHAAPRKSLQAAAKLRIFLKNCNFIAVFCQNITANKPAKPAAANYYVEFVVRNQNFLF